MTKIRSSFAAALLYVALTSACSDSSRLSPNAPSNVEGSAPTASAGVIVRPSNAADRVAEWAGAHGWAASADGLVVEGTDFITAATGVCPTPTITVRGVPVGVTAATAFTGSATCAGLTVGTRVSVMGLVKFTESGMSVTATTIALDDDDDGGRGGGGGGKGREVGGEGVIGAITGTCPTLTAVIGGYRVQLTATTEFVGGTCESLRSGTKVKVDALVQDDGSIVAEKVEIERVPGRPVSGDGPVARVTGTCPSLTMTVKGISVITSPATTFTGAACESIAPGTHIDVTGEYDGVSVAATAVAIRTHGQE